MKLLTLFFTNLLAFFLVTRVRQVVALTLVGAVAFTIVAPPAKAQLGIPAIIAAAAQVVATINNVIGPLLSAIQGTIGAINGVLNQFRNLWEQVVYPLQLINRARALVSSMIAQYRGLLTALMRVNVSSAQLPNPVPLESIMRNRGTGDFAQLTNAFGQTYRAIPQPTDAHPIERDLADIDDAMALANLKTLKASDAMVDQMMAAANAIEDEGVNMAPGVGAVPSGRRDDRLREESGHDAANDRGSHSPGGGARGSRQHRAEAERDVWRTISERHADDLQEVRRQNAMPEILRVCERTNELDLDATHQDSGADPGDDARRAAACQGSIHRCGCDRCRRSGRSTPRSRTSSAPDCETSAVRWMRSTGS